MSYKSLVIYNNNEYLLPATLMNIWIKCIKYDNKSQKDTRK